MMSKKVRVIVPATSANLGPGFDVLGVALNLFNEFTLEAESASRRDWGFTIEVKGEGEGKLHTGTGNIVYSAVKRVFRKCGFDFHRFRIKARALNRIPLARGLGSSASAILAGMMAANRICGDPLGREEILDLAAGMEGHPDNVAPAIYGGLCITIKDKGRFHSLPLRVPGSLKVVLCIPDYGVATAKARRALPRQVPFKDAVFNVSRVALLVGILENQRLDLLSKAMSDRLHQPYRARLVPGLNRVLFSAVDGGALGAALSGAGPSVVALCNKRPESVGMKMVRAFGKSGVRSIYRILKVDYRGARVI